ncbi:MAG: DUF1553 domain-containing protein [Acidobacteria bacterium]|nr:DUF1553 domain-containing protein [Acidobacteriota bacterium]
MKRMFRNLRSGRPLILVTTILLALVSGLRAGRPGSVRESPRLLALRLVPPKATLWGSGASQRFLALGEYSDGISRDVTSQAKLSISDTRVARLDPSGSLAFLSEGRVIFRAELAGQVADAQVEVRKSGFEEALGFADQIGTILTRRGCNDSACHGGVKGKGGFKLSLNALDPSEDYRWIVEGGKYQVLRAEAAEPIIPRINTKAPEKSLLLQKPTQAIPHGGGERFAVDSQDYRTLLSWIGKGAAYGESRGSKIDHLEVFPREVVLDLRGRHQILVTAHLADGRQKDITGDVYYQPMNSAVARLTPEGLVEAVGLGETSVLIRAVGHNASARIGVVAGPLPTFPKLPRSSFIDDQVFAKLRKFHIEPSGVSTDAEFLRRVCLDLTGTLPPPERVQEFLGSRDRERRDKVIETLLKSPEYLDYWTFRFSDLFRVRGRPTPANLYWQWLRGSLATGRPYDQIVRERIAAQGVSGPPTHYLASEGKPPSVDRIVSEEMRVYLGRRMDCAQCHNHPFDTWTQNQFWGIAAFFGRMTNTAWAEDQVLFDDPEGHEVDLADMGTTSLTFRVVRHPRTQKPVAPRFFDGQGITEAEKLDPRLALARMITSHPYFAEAVVNRVWGYFFGRGIVNPVDDFRWSNPPTHPELLEALARDFREHGYDLRHLMRLIVRSTSYQLSSTPTATNREDLINYSHSWPRPLDAEVLSDAVSGATGVPEIFATADSGKLPRGTRAIQLKYPANYESRFLEAFGRPFREVLPERSALPTMAQALHTLVGSTFTETLGQKGGRLDRLLQRGASDAEVIGELHLASLGRLPDREEVIELSTMISRKSSRREAIEGLLWALISSEEFSHNH